MKIEYGGKVYDFELTQLSVEECEAIEKFCGARGLGDWSNQLTAANTKALQALWWVIRRQAGEDPGPVARRDPALLPVRLNNAYVDAERAELEAKVAAAEAEADAGPDPTRPSAASSPAPAATTTTPAPAAAAPSLPG